MVYRRTLAAVIPALLGMLACSLQGGQASSQADLPATITAQALTLQAPLPNETPSVVAGNSTVQVSVTSNTNCRTGPSQDYDKVLVAEPGDTFEVVGKSSAVNYWIITNPAGGTCWLWGQYAVVSGDAGNLPDYPAPATPVPQATKTPKPTQTTDASSLLPNAPFGLGANGYSCGIVLEGLIPKWHESFTLVWTDTSDNEQGFGVYQNDLLIATLPANTETYVIDFKYPYGAPHPLYDLWNVEAFNLAGSSDRAQLKAPTCNLPTPSS